MHTHLFEEGLHPEFAKYYQEVKQKLIPNSGVKYGYHFQRDDFYIYMICHMYKHYERCGTGLRSLLDYYMFLNKESALLDWSYIHGELEKLKIINFEEKIRVLVNKIFGKGTQDFIHELTDEEWTELNYFVYSGVYGNMRNYIINKMNKGSSNCSIQTKLRFLIKRIVPEKYLMERWCRQNAHFFVRHSKLLPLAYLWRIFHLSGKSWREFITIWRVRK